MLQETIARLTGKLVFDVDMAGIRKFEAGLRRAQQQMNAFATKHQETMKQMQTRLQNSDVGKTLGLESKALKERTKAQDAYNRSLDRQGRAEKVLENQRRQTFNRELKTQKLVATGHKEATATITKGLQERMRAAVEAAKAAAHADLQGKPQRGRPASAERQLMQAKLRQARLEAIHAKTQERSAQARVTLENKMTQGQILRARIQQMADTAREKAIRQQGVIQARANAEKRQSENHTMRQQRFMWAQQRQQHWEATRNAPGGFFSRAMAGAEGRLAGAAGAAGLGMDGSAAIGAVTAALGPFGAALLAATAAAWGVNEALNAMNARVDAREGKAVEAESFNGKFLGLSKDPEVAKRQRDRFIKMQMQNGGVVDGDTAQDYSILFNNLTAIGRTADYVDKTWLARSQAYTVAGVSKESQREVNKQLGQMAADGVGAASDYNVITDQMPALVPYLGKAYGEQNNIQDPQKAVAAMVKHVKKGKGVQYTWFERAFELMNADRTDAFQRNLAGTANARRQYENQVYLNENQINTDAELSKTLQERIDAERRLNNAMQPVEKAFQGLDGFLGIVTTGTKDLGAAILEATLNIQRSDPKYLAEQEAKKKADQAALDMSLADRREGKATIGDSWWSWILSDGEKKRRSDAIAKDPTVSQAAAWNASVSLPGDALGPIGVVGARADQLGRMAAPMPVQQLPSDLVPRDQLTASDVKTAIAEGMRLGITGTVDPTSGTMSPSPLFPAVNITQNVSVEAFDTEDAARKLAPAMKDASNQALRDAFGQMRAQQAEK